MLAEIRQPVVVLDLGIVDVAGRIGPLIGIRPGQRHIAHAQPVEIAQQTDVILNRVAALDSQQRSKLLLFVGALNIVDGVCHHHAVGMARRLLVN